MNDQSNGQGRIELFSALHFVRRSWVWICSVAVLMGVGALGVSFAMQRLYEAEVVALPVGDQRGLPSLRSLMGGYGALSSLAGISLPGSENPAEMAVVRLKSRGFIEGFIKENDLLPVLFPKKWEASKGVWRKPDESPTLQDGYALLTNKVLRVAVDKRSNTVTVEVRWTDPVTASTWANLIVERLNRVTREEAVTEANKSVIYLQREFENAQSVELRQSIAMLLEGQMNRRMMAVTQPDYSLKVIDAARPSEIDRYASPQRGLIAAAGAMMGALLGALIAWLRSGRTRPDTLAE
jgi:uncharacterized protein involved in exopolysaccharide biosynthesis